MKKIFALGWMLVAALALTNCSKDEEATTVAQKHNFELIADMGTTRTAIDGYTSSWVAGDQMNVFFGTQGAWVGTTDQIFTITEENLSAGKFTGTLDASYDDTKAYDWYAIYPYSKYVYTSTNYEGGTSTPEQISYISVGYQTQTQTGNNSTAHLCKSSAPLYGKAVGVVGTDIPSMTMQHLASFIKVSVTNNLGKAVTVNSVKLVSEMATISGSNYICLTEDKPVYTPHDTKSYSDVTLTVKEGEAIEVGESADFYMSITPFNTEDEVETLTVEITTTAGHTTTKSFTIPIGKTFSAGKVNTLKVTANADNTVVNTYEIPFEDNLSWTTEVGHTYALTADEMPEYYSATAYTYVEESALKLGSSSNRGYFTAAPFNLTEDFVVVVKAKNWQNDSSTISITVDDETSSVQTLTSAYKYYAFPFTAKTKESAVTVNVNGKRGNISYFAILKEFTLPPYINAPTSLNIDANGVTDATIEYSIENPLENEELSASVDVDWVHLGKPADGILTYSVDPYTEVGADARTCNITLTYTDAEPVVIPVSQTAPVSANAETISLTFSDLSLENAADLTEIAMDANIKLVFAVGTNSNGNSPKYYANGTNARVYTGNTLAIQALNGKTITKVQFYFSGTYKGNWTADSGNWNTPIWTGTADVINMTTSANSRFTQIEVTYE